MEESTKLVFDSLQRGLGSPAQTILAWVPGDHFYEIPERYRLALAWLFGRKARGSTEERK
ncbi:MAG: hypothetical protein ACLSAP_04515 [Oscillospiraceae bacterium]